MESGVIDIDVSSFMYNVFIYIFSYMIWHFETKLTGVLAV